MQLFHSAINLKPHQVEVAINIFKVKQKFCSIVPSIIRLINSKINFSCNLNLKFNYTNVQLLKTIQILTFNNSYSKGYGFVPELCHGALIGSKKLTNIHMTDENNSVNC